MNSPQSTFVPSLFCIFLLWLSPGTLKKFSLFIIRQIPTQNEQLCVVQVKHAHAEVVYSKIVESSINHIRGHQNIITNKLSP